MIKIIIGTYKEIKKKCSCIFPNGYFDFDFLYVSESERFREIDRFLFESRHLLRFKNEYEGNAVIDLTEWNDRNPNSYFDAFMYFLKDNSEKYNCVFISSSSYSEELSCRLKKLFGEIIEINLSGIKKKGKIKIGFSTENGRNDENVRG